MIAGAATLTVTVLYRERIAMPPNAALIVTLADVSRADAPAELVASRRVEEPGNVPIDVELTYDPSIIDERFAYVVRGDDPGGRGDVVDLDPGAPRPHARVRRTTSR